MLLYHQNVDYRLPTKHFKNIKIWHLLASLLGKKLRINNRNRFSITMRSHSNSIHIIIHNQPIHKDTSFIFHN